MAKSVISGQTRKLVPVPKVGTNTHWIEAKWYRYQKLVVPVPLHQKRTGTGTNQSGTGTGDSRNPVFIPLTLLSLVFVHRLFRDPNKGLMGVHIRVYERENVLYLATSAKLHFASTIFV